MEHVGLHDTRHAKWNDPQLVGSNLARKRALTAGGGVKYGKTIGKSLNGQDFVNDCSAQQSRGILRGSAKCGF